MIDKLLDLIPKEHNYIYFLIIVPMLIYKVYAKPPYEKLFEGKSSKLIRNIMDEILAFILVFIITLFVPVKDSKFTIFELIAINIVILPYWLNMYVAGEHKFSMKNSISRFLSKIYDFGKKYQKILMLVNLITALIYYYAVMMVVGHAILQPGSTKELISSEININNIGQLLWNLLINMNVLVYGVIIAIILVYIIFFRILAYPIFRYRKLGSNSVKIYDLVLSNEEKKEKIIIISSFGDYLVCSSEDDKNSELIIRKDSIIYMVAHNNKNTHSKTK